MNSWAYTINNYREDYQLNETLFSLANGYLGVRGSFEEGIGENIPSVRGAYINAFFEREEITYGEKLYGFPDNSESILNVIDTQSLLINIEGEPFALHQGEVLSFERTLDFKTGILHRNIKWKSPKGNQIHIEFKRLVSFIQRELFLIDIILEPLNFSGNIEITSIVNGDVSNIVVEDDPRIGTSNAQVLQVQEIHQEENKSFVKAKTKNSNLAVVAGIYHEVSNTLNETIKREAKQVKHCFNGALGQNEKISLTKYAVYTDTRRHSRELQKNIELLNQASKNSFQHYASLQEDYLSKFWEFSNIRIDGDAKMNQGIRFNLFHLLQSIGKDPWSNISAKGLSGEGYEGHYFWDTEIYIFPFFLFTNPDLAKNLLNYRYTILDAARLRAKQMGHSIGALYPWRTIAGEECSPFFPAGTAQYHINVDVAYSVTQYFEVTEDIDFMINKGLEMLIELARLMHHIGHYRADGKFCIDAVTGPDEYTCIVNNNYYTNLLTKNLFSKINSIWKELKSTQEDALNEIQNKLDFSESELLDFGKAGKAMYLPYDETLNLHPQDDSFFNKKVWDFENTPKEKYPLLLHFHPLTLYRHQVCKQADTILGHFLMEGETNIETIKNDYEYYEKITTHDSSLSTCIFSIMANRIGQFDKAYDYFMNTARLDIDNLHHNTQNGIHTACMGGSWMSIVFGFAGMRIIDGVLHFRPNLPKSWQSLEFRMKFKNRALNTKLQGENIDIELLEGDSIQIMVNDKLVEVSPVEPSI